MEQNYIKVHYASSEDEYNSYADIGWRYITFQQTATEDAAGKSVNVTLILGWPEDAGVPMYPNDPHWVRP